MLYIAEYETDVARTYTYEVSTRTSTVKYANTDGDIFITITGKNGKYTSALDSDANDREKGQ